MIKTVKIKGQILTAYAESCAGPGWANSPIWVIVRESDGTIVQHCLQPMEQTEEMYTLYGISQATHAAMTRAVKDAYGTPKGQRD